MLHEVLLALSGHPSPLLDDNVAEDFPFITPAEINLLKSLARLASLNRALQRHASCISTSHPSSICRAIANELCALHLPQFRRWVVQVEQRILSGNPSNVGAYNSVPLASIVGDFSGWERAFEWYWETLCFVLPADGSFAGAVGSPRKDGLRNGAALMNKLRLDVHTGYPEIEDAALSLLKTAESVWMKQLSAWLLQGYVSKQALSDFFIQPSKARTDCENGFFVDYSLLPDFLPRETSQSIRYIGKTFNYTDNRALNDKTHAISKTLEHLRLLSNLESPINPASLDFAVSGMRSALTRQLIHGLLPVQEMIQTLSSLRDYFLLYRIGFTDALVIEADQHLQHRHLQIRTTDTNTLLDGLAGVMMKEAEVSRVLLKTWTQLAPETTMDPALDDCIEWGREHVSLEFYKTVSKAEELSDDRKLVTSSAQVNSDIGFHDFLLSVPTKLSMSLKAPLNLFLTMKDLEAYSDIHAYLLSIRRAQIHLSDLWRWNTIRRGSPVNGGSRRSSRFGIASAKISRTKTYEREHSMRKIWATASAALSLVTELGGYLISEVIVQSWSRLQRWISGSPRTSSHDRQSGNKSSSSDHNGQPVTRADLPQHDGIVSERAQDLELLTLAHRQYLSALRGSLLLGYNTFIHLLRDFLTQIDQLVAFIGRLQIVYSNSDLQDEGVSENLSRNYKQEEKEVHQEVTESSARVEDSMQRLIKALREINASRFSNGSHRDAKIRAKTDFEPWKSTGIDRLLLKLPGNDST